jgi:hypothetical protein
MLPAVAYFATALALLALGRRFVAPFSRAAAAVLLLLPLTFTGRALLTGRVMAPVDIQYLSAPFPTRTPYDAEMLDVATQMVPWRAALRESIARAEWPLLNQHTLCGDVLAAAAQPAVYSPFTWIALLMEPAISFNFTGAIAFFLAVLGAFLFARDLGCGETASLFGAVAFAFNGPLAFAILWPLGFSWALLPLVMLGARRVVRERQVALLTVALVLEILAGHPESALHVIALGVSWGLFELLRAVIASRRNARADSRPAATKPLASLLPALLAGAFALGLTAIYVLPVLDAADQTVEHQFRQNVFAKSKRAAPPNEIAAGVLTSLFPWLHQQKWLAPMRTPAFIGIGSLVLAAMLAGLRGRRGESHAVSRAESNSESWMLFTLFLICAAAALMAPPVSSLLHALPLFDITLNERLLFGASFCAAMLAARGLASFGWRMAVTVLALLAAGTLVIQHAHLTDGHVTTFRAYTLLGELVPLALAVLVTGKPETASGFCVVAGALAGPRGAGAESENLHGPGQARAPATTQNRPLAAPRSPQTSWRLIALLALLLAQRVMEDGRWYPALDRAVAFPRLAVLEPVRRSGDRMVAKGMAFLPNTSAVYGVDDVRGYEAMTFRPLAETYPLWAEKIPIWFNRVDDLGAPMLSMMNVRWMLNDDGRLIENPHALPRAFVPRHVRLGWPRELVLPEMRSETDFGERAWIESPSLGGAPEEVENGPGAVAAGVATMERDGWVVVSQANWRGWRAWVDGRRTTVVPANHAFLAVYVPRGRHTLRLAFRSQSFVVGRAVTAGTLLLLCTVIILVHRRRGTIAAPDESNDRRL